MMNVLLANATDEEHARVVAVLGPDLSIGKLDSDRTDYDWPLAVVFFRTAESALETLRKARNAVGESTVLVGVSVEPVDAHSLIAEGLDDLSLSLDGFLSRYPFLVARLRQRARRQLRLQAIMENTVDGIVVIDEVGTMHSVNKAVTTIFGFGPEELLGQNVSMLMPSPDREKHDGYLSSFLSTREPRIIGIGREVVGKRKNGSLFPLDLAVSEVQLDGASMFTGVVRDISHRRELESEVLRAGEEERRRIGRDLHDGLGQALTGTGLIAQNVARSLSKAGNPAAADVLEIADLIRDADEQARALAQGLVPVELDRNGLSAALERLCKQAQRLFGGSCEYERGEPLVISDSNAVINVYRIAQEAVSNAFKHGRADKVCVTLVEVGDFFQLRVTDNGIGFSPKAGESSGMGVRIMHYRASVLGGQLDIRTRKEGGTLVSCDIPRPDGQSERAEK
ncbi:MAG: two-component system sensor kinase FixL [Rhodothermales bacterium]|jgi:two-component system sensor kinase FixL